MLLKCSVRLKAPTDWSQHPRLKTVIGLRNREESAEQQQEYICVVSLPPDLMPSLLEGSCVIMSLQCLQLSEQIVSQSEPLMRAMFERLP